MNKIGYPDKWRDYSKLENCARRCAGQPAARAEFNFKRDLAKIGKPVDKGEWYMSPPTVNAYYSSQENNVNFPAGYFQPPFFSDKEDDAANYGDMGSTIGHELTHGFDDEGRQYDKDGNLKDWWTKDDETKFNEKAHSAWSISTTPSRPFRACTSTASSRSAKISPTSAAYGWHGWRGRTRRRPQHLDMSAKTDGYTPEQRFWIAYAQQWCTQTAARAATQPGPNRSARTG